MMIPKTQNRNRRIMRHRLVANPIEYSAHLALQALLAQNLMAFTQFAFGVVRSLCASMALPAWFLRHYRPERIVVASCWDRDR
jgi:hypothetical protein